MRVQCADFFKNRSSLSKKTVRSSQAGTEITQNKRLDYWESIRDVLADDLVFVDEMGVLLGLMRGMGRSKNRYTRIYAIRLEKRLSKN